MKRAYYNNSIVKFLQEDSQAILGALVSNSGHQSLEKTQQNAWERQIQILKAQLFGLNGHIYFEFSIPRMGKRVDNIVVLGDKIFLLEFKIGNKSYDKYAIDQVIDYALDLRNFHQGSHQACLVPVLVSENAENMKIKSEHIRAAMNFNQAILLNAQQLADFLHPFNQESLMDVQQWETSPYKPTPTIIEAAQALYQKHSVQEITRSDAGAENLSVTTNCINQIIEQAKSEQKKQFALLLAYPVLVRR